MSWTEERIALLADLWGQGKTAAQIAQILGGVTRNAVIGKAHRLSLAARVSPLQQNSAKKKPALPVQVGEGVPGKSSQANGKVSMMDLTSRMCCFPIGDPKKPDFGFCGAGAVLGLPYCAAHAAAAYQPASRARRALAVAEGEGAEKAASA